MIIRKARPNDLYDIRHILRKAHLQNTRMGFIFPASDISTHQMREYMSRHEYFVLLVNGRKIGTIALKKRTSFWEIGSFVVLPQYQRNGWGNQLLRFAEKTLRERKVKYAYLFTPKQHPLLPRYYDSKGYFVNRTVTFRNKKWIRFRKKLF